VSGKYTDLELLQCTHCGDVPLPLVVHRSETPYLARLEGLWRYPLSKAGLFALVSAGAVMAYCFGLLAFIPLGVATFYAYFFHLIRLTAKGSEDIGPPEITDAGPDLIYPALRGVVASSLLLLPALAYLRFARGFRIEGALEDPVVWLLIVISLAYLPMALVVAAAGGVLRVLNPLWVVGLALKLGRDYAVCVALVGVLSLAQALLFVTLAALGLFTHGPLLVWLAASMLLYLPFLMARVLGLLLYNRGDAIGLGMPSDYETPVLAERPRGVPRPSRDVEALLGQSRTAEATVASTGGAGVAPAERPRRHQPIALDEPPPPERPSATRPAPRTTLDPASLPPLKVGDDEGGQS
jgi:hypothetical protein